MFRLKCITSPRFGINTFINAMQTKTNSGNFANALLQYQVLKYLNTLATNSKCCASTVSIGAEATCFDFDPEATANHSKCFWRPIPFRKKKKNNNIGAVFPHGHNNVFVTRFIPRVALKTKHTHSLPRRPSVLWSSLVLSNGQSIPPSKVSPRRLTRIWLLRLVSVCAQRTSARLAPKTGTKRRLGVLPLWLDLSFCLAFSAVAGKWTCWPLRSAAVPSMCQSERWRKSKTVV